MKTTEAKTQTGTPTVTHKLPLLRSLPDLLEAARLSGSHFFEPATMKSFGSKLASDFFPLTDSEGRAGLFITSEKDRYGFNGAHAWGGARLYTVRLASFSPNGLSIDAAGPFNPTDPTDHGFGAFKTLARARAFAKKAATLGTPERLALHRNEAKRRKQNGWPAPSFQESLGGA